MRFQTRTAKGIVGSLLLGFVYFTAAMPSPAFALTAPAAPQTRSNVVNIDATLGTATIRSRHIDTIEQQQATIHYFPESKPTRYRDHCTNCRNDILSSRKVHTKPMSSCHPNKYSARYNMVPNRPRPKVSIPVRNQEYLSIGRTGLIHQYYNPWVNHNNFRNYRFESA